MQSSNEPVTGGPHLTLERLAAFDDAPLTVSESAHLAVCAACRSEYEGVVAVVGLADALRRQPAHAAAPRLVEFDAILAGVRAAGAPAPHAASRDVPPELLRETPRGSAVAGLPAVPRRGTPRWRQAAAALLLVGGGAVLGRMSGDSTLADRRGFAEAITGAPAASPAAMTSVSFADRPFADLSYRSVEQATIALNEAQREYERASLWLASNDTTLRDPEVFRARLAALDQMMEASRVALRDAPQDPVLNHYYLAAHSAREATLQALGSALPVDKIIERY